MNPEFEDKTQPELFEDYRKAPLKRLRLKTQALFSRPKPNITFTYENFIFLLIGFIFWGIVSFSLGVERGKHISREKTGRFVPRIENRQEVSIEEKIDASTKAKSYTIQVASFKKLDAAEKEAARLKASGYTTYVFESGDYFRICVGSFANRNEADKVLANLRKKFPDCYITER